MKHSVHFDETYNCIIGVLVGTVDLKALNRYTEEIKKVSLKHDCKRIIYDLRKAKLDFSTFDIYTIPGLIETKGLGRLWKRAIVIPHSTKDKDDYLFFETVALNQGYTVKVFIELNEAKDWLK